MRSIAAAALGCVLASAAGLAGCSGRVLEPVAVERVSEARPGPHGAAGGSGPAGGMTDGGDGDRDPGETRPDAPACSGPGDVGAPVPMRRLTAAQVERTVADVLGVRATVPVADERILTYRSNVTAALDAAGARGYLDFAETVAARADRSRCTTDEACRAFLFDEVGPLLFRRPLGDDERARYAALYEQGASEGARWVLEAMLQSPSFLYLDEVASEDGYLDDYAIAARLALALWGRNPDADLLARAAEGGLSSPEQVRDEVARMLEDPRSEGGIRDFVDQWLELHELEDADARPDLAALGEDTLAALRDEPVRLVRELLLQGAGLHELMTTAESVRLEALDAIYGSDVVATDASVVSLDPARRAGVLTLPGVMAALSHAGVTSPTLRGFAVLSGFLCDPPPPPPAGVNVTLPEVGPDATARERLELHFSDETCGSCHRSMDGIGFAFERIDWLGRSRDEQDGRAIDDASEFVLGGVQVRVEGAVELATTLANHPDVAECIGRQWARYATGIPENPDARCLVQALGEEVAAPGGLVAMLLAYFSSDWFRREGGAP